ARGDLSERRLAEPGRPGEQHVVERLAAPPRSFHEECELALQLLLADELLQALRSERAVQLLLAGPHGRDLDADLSRGQRHAAFTAVRSAAAIRSSASASAPAERSAASSIRSASEGS